MPLTSKGSEILAKMRSEYGSEKGERVFYASRNAGKLTGVDRQDADEKPRADMLDEDWAKLRTLLDKFFVEEEKEAEHKSDSVPKGYEVIYGTGMNEGYVVICNGTQLPGKYKTKAEAEAAAKKHNRADDNGPSTGMDAQPRADWGPRLDACMAKGDSLSKRLDAIEAMCADADPLDGLVPKGPTFNPPREPTAEELRKWKERQAQGKLGSGGKGRVTG